MRLRIYKRKVVALLLLLGAAACALVLWGGTSEAGGAEAGGGGGSSSSSSSNNKREEAASPPPPPGDRPLPPAVTSSSLPVNNGRHSNSSSVSREEAPTGLNRTLRYRSLVYRLNFDQPVRNEARWRPGAGGAAAPGEVAVALVVQVHERADHLRILLDSLRRTPGVDKVLLVLSHDVWSAELNALAASVDFCAVLQIFFPFSLQLYPGEFPGTDPRDCPRDVGQAAALRAGCLNAHYPDAFGHYRESTFTQTKHHWWWKLHFVWERLRALREHPGLVVFLEEDHYLAPDFYHVLQRLWALRQRECPECQLLSLGTYATVRGSFAGRADKVELKTWKSTEHNMGMVFARDTYQQLIGCTDAFCTYDDYNWDWTLQHLTVGCLPHFWKVLVPEIPRIFHTGDCGMHHKKSCQPSVQSAKIDSLLNINRQYLFPETLTISKRYSMTPLSPHVKNGGWGDIRDHELCKSYRRLQ